MNAIKWPRLAARLKNRETRLERRLGRQLRWWEAQRLDALESEFDGLATRAESRALGKVLRIHRTSGGSAFLSTWAGAA